MNTIGLDKTLARGSRSFAPFEPAADRRASRFGPEFRADALLTEAACNAAEEELRRAKRSKFATVKYVYPAPVMSELRSWFDEELSRRLPLARILYWT